MNEKILITAALPYANGALHFGHFAGAYLPADCYARYMRFIGNDVLFISGSDEYGFAISMSAELAKRSPQEHVAVYHKENKELFEKMMISFDHYSRTTWSGHVATSQQYFLDLLANGYVEQRESDQLYSPNEDTFLADRYVVGTCPRCGYEAARGDECGKCGASFEATDLKNPRSKMTNSSLILKKTTHWYLRLDFFKDKLSSWLKTKEWKSNVINFVASYIDDLRPRAITRDTNWGIPVPLPEGKDKVLYVWFEAPIGYISATKEWAELQGNSELWKKYWMEEDTRLVQFLGKDNIPFHAVIFPAMTMGQNSPYKLVDDLVANEFYNLNGRQFSKSDGWYIDLKAVLERYSADQIRYAICSNAPETQDSDFTWKDFQMRVNGDLAGKFGNFIHRVLVFIKKEMKDKLPQLKEIDPVDTQFLEEIDRKLQEIGDSFSHFRVRRACQLLMELAQLGNIYFDTKKPWKDAKAEDTRARMETTLCACIECIKRLSCAAYPVLPHSAEEIWKLLGMKEPLHRITLTKALSMPCGALQDPKPIFRRIEDSEIEKEIELLECS